MARSRADRPQESVNGFTSALPDVGAGVKGVRPADNVNGLLCEVCRKPMSPGRRGEPKRFCSSKCRYLAWQLRILTEALAAGEAEGLRAKIQEVGGTG
jgi:hypothetical protein